MSGIPTRQWWTLLGALTIVHLIGMIYIDIMEVDAAQYASMSQEMMQSGNYLQVEHRHVDYLDKPPLLFWVTSTSFKLFGISNFTFRLPSFLFLILGLFATFKLAEVLYDRRTAQLAVLVLYSTQAYFLFAHDVRTDTILANVVIFAIWQLWLFITNKNALNMALGAVGVGLAMLEKGPIGLMVPVLALGSQVLFTHKLKIILRWEWLLGLVVIALMLAPMVYGLYEQFGMKGVEFYFWTQSFGRITGQSEWRDSSTVFYFVHTFLWAFLPWMFIAYFGIFRNLYRLVASKFSQASGVEIITLAGFVLTFIAMSLSRYKLPHYIFVVFPLAAIITADTVWIILDKVKTRKVFTGIQVFTNLVLMVAAGLLMFISFWPANIILVIVVLACFGFAVFLMILSKDSYKRIFLSSLITIMGVNILLNAHVYPTLLTYQAGSMAGKYLAEQNLPEEAYGLYTISHGLDFYSGSVAPLIGIDTITERSNILVYTNERGMNEIRDLGVGHELVKEFDRFHVTELTMEFLNPNTRSNTLEKRYLIKVN